MKRIPWRDLSCILLVFHNIYKFHREWTPRVVGTLQSHGARSSRCTSPRTWVWTWTRWDGEQWGGKRKNLNSFLITLLHLIYTLRKTQAKLPSWLWRSPATLRAPQWTWTGSSGRSGRGDTRGHSRGHQGWDTTSGPAGQGVEPRTQRISSPLVSRGQRMRLCGQSLDWEVWGIWRTRWEN